MKLLGIRPALATTFLLFMTGALAMIFMPLSSSCRAVAGGPHCMSNLKQIGLGHVMYAADYDSWYPPVEWKPAVAPYIKDHAVYRCPEVPEGGSGYAYNRLLAGRRLPETKGLEKVAMLFESNDLRPGAVGDQIKPLQPRRHEDRLNLAFADGHAKRITFRGIGGIQMDPLTELR